MDTHQCHAGKVRELQGTGSPFESRIDGSCQTSDGIHRSPDNAPHQPDDFVRNCNATLVTALFVCSLLITGAMYLLVQLDEPHSGYIKVSSAPLRAAIDQLGR
jgi:hypothetical protein